MPESSGMRRRGTSSRCSMRVRPRPGAAAPAQGRTSGDQPTGAIAFTCRRKRRSRAPWRHSNHPGARGQRGSRRSSRRVARTRSKPLIQLHGILGRAWKVATWRARRRRRWRGSRSGAAAIFSRQCSPAFGGELFALRWRDVDATRPRFCPPARHPAYPTRPEVSSSPTNRAVKRAGTEPASVRVLNFDVVGLHRPDRVQSRTYQSHGGRMHNLRDGCGGRERQTGDHRRSEVEGVSGYGKRDRAT
jgi:hypothetical protein